MALNHRSHNHPNTRAARAACRKAIEGRVEKISIDEKHALAEEILNTKLITVSVKLDAIPVYNLKKGMRVHFDKLVKYNGYDHNFFGYCWKCKENKCKEPISISEYVEGEIIEVIRWADNSTDIKVQTDDGKQVIHQVEAPHGDICF